MPASLEASFPPPAFHPAFVRVVYAPPRAEWMGEIWGFWYQVASWRPMDVSEKKHWFWIQSFASVRAEYLGYSKPQISVGAPAAWVHVMNGSFPKVMRKLCQIADGYGTKVHGLGYTASDVLDYGFYSVDSSSWLSGGRYGTVYNFKGGKLYQKNAERGKKTVHHRTVTRNNFHQWVMYQNYLDRFD